MLLVLTSTFIIIVDTHKDFRVETKLSRLDDPNETNPKIILRETTDPYLALNVIDLLTTLIFTAELLLRFTVCPSKMDFMKSFLNWMDIISLVAQWILFLLYVTITDYWTLRLYKICSILRVFRIFRIFRLAKHYQGLQILILALRSSFRELMFLAIFVLVGMILFATAIFYAEMDNQYDFLNIPSSFWWALITMTTVGYGDVYPTTDGGFLVGAFCAVCGIITIGLPIPIIATNFQVFYQYIKLRDSLKDKKSLVKDINRKITGNIKALIPFNPFKHNDDNGSEKKNKGSPFGSLGSRIHPAGESDDVSTTAEKQQDKMDEPVEDPKHKDPEQAGSTSIMNKSIITTKNCTNNSLPDVENADLSKMEENADKISPQMGSFGPDNFCSEPQDDLNDPENQKSPKSAPSPAKSSLPDIFAQNSVVATPNGNMSTANSQTFENFSESSTPPPRSSSPYSTPQFHLDSPQYSDQENGYDLHNPLPPIQLEPHSGKKKSKKKRKNKYKGMMMGGKIDTSY